MAKHRPLPGSEEELQEALQLSREYAAKDPAEINAIFDTGCFYEICNGFMVLALNGIEAEPELIERAKAQMQQMYYRVKAHAARTAIPHNIKVLEDWDNE